MASDRPNPAVLSPESRFSPVQHRTYSPSPTRQPKINTHIDRDPLLANLSSRATLKALAEADVLSHTQGKTGDALSESIAEASASERALGVRAAYAGKQLRDWCEELQSWVWSSHGFALPALGTELRQLLEWAQKYAETDAPGQEKQRDDDQEYWGSLPARVVQDLEKRLGSIRENIQTLDIEELKDYIRLAHCSSRSRSGSRLDYGGAHRMPSDYAYLDDFTALITALILNALPYLARLESLLDCWWTRLTLLRRIPDWLEEMDDTEMSLNLGWQSIGRRKDTEPWADSDITREALKIMKAVLEDKVSSLGQQTDAMLDLLEGRDDVLPAEWIDRMDLIEEDYRSWVVEAERVVMKNEWEAKKAADKANRQVDKENQPEPTSLNNQVVDNDQNDQTGLVKPTHALSLDGQDELLDGNEISLQDHDYFNIQKPRKINLQPHVYSESRTPSDMSPPDSASSGGFFSYVSSPELSTASRIEYIKSSPNLPVSAESPVDLDVISRQSSQRTARETDTANDSLASSGTISPSPRPRTLGFTPKPTIKEDDASVDPLTSENEFEPSSPKVENASRHSLEVVRPGVVCNVSVKRSGSYSSNKSNLSASKEHDTVTEASSTSQPITEITCDAPLASQTVPKPAVTSFEGGSNAVDAVIPSTPHVTKGPSLLSSDKSPKSSTGRPRGPKSPPMSPRSSKSTDEQIEDRISSILTTLPTKIRLTSRENEGHTDSPSGATLGYRKGDKNITPLGKTGRAQSSTPGPYTPGLTLSPAKKPRHQPDSEIKLYHLHQPGKEVPIKLYIRLVGEGGERVMVRVGGGWADLGEYLKEYATHHNKRSGGDFKVTSGIQFQSMSSVPTLSGFGSSNPRTPSSSRPSTPTTQAPKTFANIRKSRLSTGDARNPSTPEAFTSHNMQQSATPRSADSPVPSGSRRSSFRSSWGGQDETPLGLAGPKAKVAGISLSKQAWVDGMMDQARKASAEKKKGNADFGDLGKAGATKRLFLKGRGLDG